jgi:hypothetical protein
MLSHHLKDPVTRVVLAIALILSIVSFSPAWAKPASEEFIRGYATAVF